MHNNKSLVIISQTLFSLIIIAMLSGCTKSNNGNSNTNSAYSLKFKANGILYTFTGNAIDDPNGDEAAITNDFGGTGSNNGVDITYPDDYTLYGFDGENYLRIGFLQMINGNKLQKGTYNINDFNCDTRLAQKVYYPGITGVVTITSDANNKYSGTFTATLKESMNTNTISITEGVFENLSFLRDR